MNAHAYKMIVLIFYDSETMLISSIYIISTTNSLLCHAVASFYSCICVLGTNRSLYLCTRDKSNHEDYMTTRHHAHHKCCSFAHETYGAGNQDKSTNHYMHSIMFMKHMVNMA